MTLDSSNIQHEKLEIRLVDPVIPGFSVTPAPLKSAEEKKNDAITFGKRPALAAIEKEELCNKRVKKWKKFDSHFVLKMFLKQNKIVSKMTLGFSFLHRRNLNAGNIWILESSKYKSFCVWYSKCEIIWTLAYYLAS